jgi:RND family efflux transporter MFP subunit
MKREIDLTETTEERLRREIDDLKRQLREQKSPGSSHAGPTAKPWQPSSTTLWSICLTVIVLIVIGFLAGYIPLRQRQNLIRNQALEQEQALPRMEVIEVGASSPKSELELPGNIQAITEAPILARANGYIKQRMVDIGDRVSAGQPMAEIEAPEVDQQMSQAKASLEQARAALEQSLANYEQGKSNLDLARVTAERWNALEKEGIVPKQENDQYQAQYQAQTAGVQALEKAVSAQRSNVAAAEASLAALDQVQSYRVVKAPFDGLVTLRNVDVGTLVNGGNTLLFRVAQTSTLRTYVNVPQTNANSIRVGQAASLRISTLPGRNFPGSVARTANSLDPASRTMLVEIRVPNPDRALLPGMYAQVDLSSPRTNPPLLIPGDSLVVRADGVQVAVVRSDHTVHLQKIQVGRDYGDKLEVISGLELGDMLIANPGDAVVEGVKVDPVPVETAAEKPAPKTSAN